MKNRKTVFVCNECGYESPKWMGQCICGAWNSMLEQRLSDISSDRRSRKAIEQVGSDANSKFASLSAYEKKPVLLNDITGKTAERLDTGIIELNRVLGGGMVKGSLTLISGEPGIGKSTLITQTAYNVANRYGKVLYVSGEESEEQIKLRADRICGTGTKDLYLMSETNMDNIAEACHQLSPCFLIIDSIQTMYIEELSSAPGSVAQIRACGAELMRIGKVMGIPIFIVAHVTKSGELAGPKIVEHLVDCVLAFNGERDRDLRILRSSKNRFGTTSEIGAFEMSENGLVEVDDIAGGLLEDFSGKVDGSIATGIYEGTRPLILEIQALVSPANAGFPRRTAIGADNARLNMILAVLEKKSGIALSNNDVYVNVAGGLKPETTSVDLAVALAVYSSCKSEALGHKTIAIGEIGLTGEVRYVKNAEKILKEAVRLGFNRAIVPSKNTNKSLKIDGMEIIGVTHLADALKPNVSARI